MLMLIASPTTQWIAGNRDKEFYSPVLKDLQ